MSELGIQPPEGKPTLPEAIPAPAPELQAAASSAPQSPAPQWSVPQPPPLPAPQPIYSRPPAFMYVEDPKSSREPQWVMWGICGFIAVMILAGGMAFVALRLGPSRATARATPPKWKPATPAPVVARPVVPARPSPRVSPQRTAVAQSFPLVSLPADRQIDLSLKTLWQTAESNGVAVRTIRTLKSTRQADVADQPVQCEMSCTFPQAVVLLSKLGTALPAWVPETFQLSPTQGNALRVTMTSHMYFAAETETADPVPLCPNPDVAGALAKMAGATGGKFQFKSVTVKIEGAATAAGAAATRLDAKVTLEALAQSDVDVAAYMADFLRCGGVRDLNLITSESVQAGNLSVRQFKMEFYVKSGRDADVAGAPLVSSEVSDVFRAPGWLAPAGASASPTAPSAPPQALTKPRPQSAELDAADALRRVQYLELQTVIGGKNPSCLINNRVCRVGTTVNGLTVESITADAVVVRGGGQRFELKLKKQ